MNNQVDLSFVSFNPELFMSMTFCKSSRLEPRILEFLFLQCLHGLKKANLFVLYFF